MTDGGGGGVSERELTCAICTELLYQPLALLDCLHSFCGACLKEWFRWQATSASSTRRGASNPYTCPSCRESVRTTKADWRMNSRLEDFLKVHPHRVKSEDEKRELAEHYKPGDEVLPSVQLRRGRDDSGDERVLARVQQMSVNDSSGRDSRSRRDRSSETRSNGVQLSAHNIERQESLRNLLRASDAVSHDVETEILQSIYSEGLLDGIDLDNLTTEQEEELTERIAEAYRRRHRHGDRAQNQERRERPSRSPRSEHTTTPERQTTRTGPTDAGAVSDQTPPRRDRSRPPVSRPHLFDREPLNPGRHHRRSRSTNASSDERSEGPAAVTSSASRSATDLSQTPSSDNAHRDRRRGSAVPGRSITDPDTPVPRDQVARQREDANVAVQDSQRSRPSTSDSHSRVARTTQQTSGETVAAIRLSPPQAVRPAVSNSQFAPEPIGGGTQGQLAPSVKCNRCERNGIQHELHYNCRRCLDGAYNLCIQCYRNGKGCSHWFGFGYRAMERWHRSAPPEGWAPGSDKPHTLFARRYVESSSQQPTTTQALSPSQHAPPPQHPTHDLQEGAFCDICHTFANDTYWYCPICLDGAWGYCDSCAKRGQHCTHPLLVVAHLNSLQGGHTDPAKLAFVALPHLRQDTYVNLPVDTGCDICQKSISPYSPRYHCYECSDGDYDVCVECYRSLGAQSKIFEADGPNGWRKCLNGHRMASIGFQDTSDGGYVRSTIREPVGGWALREDAAARHGAAPLPPDGGAGGRCLAMFSYWPKDGVGDELAFPKNAEIREVEAKNADWSVGVYAGRVGLFPSNHVRPL